MQIHEYQAKALLHRFGMSVPDGEVAGTVAEARSIAERLGGTVVVKAQIHAGGRGMGGGIKVAKDATEAARHAGQILGMSLVTPQTGSEGRHVARVLIERGYAIAQEYYLGIVLDRATGRITLMASREGGVEIEAVAARTPERILRLPIDPVSGFQAHHGRHLAFGLGLIGEQVKAFGALAAALYRTYIESDCTLAEINPLVLTRDGAWLPLDAKLTLDDNALFRHREFETWRDLGEEDPAEVEAKAHGLQYISLPGNIGCMVNGAGLAMATMDIIKLYGGEPANFLDVGGSASKEAVRQALRIILRDPKVKAILVNIFGGIMQCDVIAEGILAAAREVQLRVPVVIRLQGTRVEEGRRVLVASGLPLLTADQLDDAAAKVVEAMQRAVAA